jgi:hypothetical protein
MPLLPGHNDRSGPAGGQRGAAAQPAEAAIHRGVQIPPVVVRQAVLPGDDLHVQGATQAERADCRQPQHDVRGAATVWLTASTAPLSSAGGPDHGGLSGNAAANVSSPAGQGSKNMTSRYAA